MVLAKSLFCLSLLEGCKPCEECTNCRRINHGNHPDIHVVEPDGMSIKKGQIQLLQEEFAKTGVESRQKLYMIIHADRMTVNAANSLLKFLRGTISANICHSSDRTNSKNIAYYPFTLSDNFVPAVFKREFAAEIN